MNNLKFRAYIKSIQKIVNVTEIDFNNKMLTLNIATNKVYPETSYWWKETELAFSQVIIMQSTGLKDKNGKEIFEGDILKTRTRGYVIVRKENGNTMTTFKSGTNKRTSLVLSSFLEKYQVVIIGNIYENKELLENE
jgi:uncharacterized phage protein (TIGR01671 family)